MFHALAAIWRGFIYGAAEYQTAVATFVFSANGVRQILQNHLNYAVFMRHYMCYFVALVLSHWPILASGFFQVISTVVYTAVFWAVDRVVDADEQYSVSFFRNHLFHHSLYGHISQPLKSVVGMVLIFQFTSGRVDMVLSCRHRRTVIFLVRVATQSIPKKRRKKIPQG